MALSKVTIQNLDENFLLVAQFNPKEYSISKSVTWKEHKASGNNFPSVQFTTGGRRELKMELFFDTYASKENLQKYLKELEKFMLIGTQKRPPLLFVSWGENALSFKCVLEQMDRRYTMFLADGTPVRAIANVTFKEIESDKKKKSVASKKPIKVMVIKGDESIVSISSEKNPKEWRKIASFNKIDDPLHVPVGTVLKIPSE